MHINPGGRLAVNEIVGRDEQIGRYWEILERQGLILTGERRIGKSHIVFKMNEEGRTGFVTSYQELEGVRSTTELISSLYRAVGPNLSRVARWKTRALDAWQVLAPKRIGELDLPNADRLWKDLLTNAVQDILRTLDAGEKFLLVWDEFPLMIDNIKKSEGPQKAMQLLDLLRHLRQVHAGQLRMLITGSIGLHLVLKSLRDAGHTNSPVNDMYPETVPPLEHDPSVQLARALLCTLVPLPQDVDAIAERTHDMVGGFPFYIHHVADQLKLLGRQAVATDVSAAVDKLLLADNDPANLNYYVERIHTHYDVADQELALHVLDSLAAAARPAQLSEIVNLVRQNGLNVSDEAVRGACRALKQDHYLTTVVIDGLPYYDFRWGFIKCWWRRNRL